MHYFLYHSLFITNYSKIAMTLLLLNFYNHHNQQFFYWKYPHTWLNKISLRQWLFWVHKNCRCSPNVPQLYKLSPFHTILTKQKLRQNAVISAFYRSLFFIQSYKNASPESLKALWFQRFKRFSVPKVCELNKIKRMPIKAPCLPVRTK